ncbi:hypothetical protein I317_02610 [Kwoniella heveanensis CBS 569]|nr:hypothetical protein I317_02610 [Kwoniella heveanensis CBS 569]
MDEDAVASILGESSSNRASARARPPCPRRGENREFDRHFDESTAEYDPTEVDFQELRRAAWATWRTKPPAALSRPSQTAAAEDDEVLALSAQEHASSQSASSTSWSRFHDADRAAGGGLNPLGGRDDGDDDEELRRAIAMSEEEARAPKRQKRDETPEEERRMLAEAMAASLAESEAGPSMIPASPSKPKQEVNSISHHNIQSTSGSDTYTAPISIPSSPLPSITASPAPSTDSAAPTILKIGGQVIDRAQLEKERRERQAARQAAISGISSSFTTSSTSSAPLKTASSSLASSTLSSSESHPFQASGPFPTDAAGEYYLDGELRHVALRIGEHSRERTFSPQQVVGNHSQIALVIVSSFVIEDQWLLDANILPPPEVVPTMTVRPHRKDQPEYNGKIELKANGEMWVYPKMLTGFGSAHMKYFWIFYKTGRLRVAISTANLVSYDYQEIENTVFVQDFLPLVAPIPLVASNTTHDFPLQFARLFTHLRIHTGLRNLIRHHPAGSAIPFTPENNFADLAKYDWSKVRVRIVMSIPGQYTGHEEIGKLGISRLGKVLNEQGWVPRSGEKLDVEFQGSSLGTYSLEWFDKFYSFVSGKTSQQLVHRTKPTSWPDFHILFPTLATVERSIGGKPGGGTMFCGKAFNSVTKGLFYDANSKRGGVLMHTKMLIAIFEPAENRLGIEKVGTPTKLKRKADEMDIGSKDVGGWIYVGSHNFSPSAWGNVDVKKNPPTLNIRNYELGIVFPLDRKNARSVADRVAPYKRPARKYSASDIPWDQNAFPDVG